MRWVRPDRWPRRDVLDPVLHSVGLDGGKRRQVRVGSASMAFPVGEEQLRAAEAELGRCLPAALRERLLRDNGGQIRVDGYPSDDPIWQLHPVWDATDRKRMGRTANHVVRETQEARASIGDVLPARSIVIADNGTGDLLLLLADGDSIVWWDHETGEVEPVEVDWR